MIKIIKYIGIAALACFSFYYTEKSMIVLKEKDPIMIKIKAVAKSEMVEPVSAMIQDNYIIPGINGMMIDIDRSYDNMKRYGAYSESKLIYKDIIPPITISNNYNKYIISGNKNKNIISLVFKVNDTKYLDSIIEILDKNNTVGNFFIEAKIIEENKNLISGISQKHYINFIESNLDNIEETKSKLQKTISNKFMYCLTDNEDKKLLKACTTAKMRIIIPSIKTTNSIFNEIKSNLSKGSIISLNLTKNTVEELEVVIKFIKSKGYVIENLKKQLAE